MKDKQEALKRLKEIENETKELRKIIEEADEPKTIFERVKSIKDAILELGENDSDVIDYRSLQKSNTSIKLLRFQEITIFCKAMNEGKKSDWLNKDTQKWYIWFDCRNKVGAGFVYNVYYGCYLAYLPACHTYIDQKRAEHASKHIEQIYYDYITA